jgi:hypothetical protein
MLPLFLLHEDVRQAEQFIWNKSKIESADFELTENGRPIFLRVPAKVKR